MDQQPIKAEPVKITKTEIINEDLRLKKPVKIQPSSTVLRLVSDQLGLNLVDDLGGILLFEVPSVQLAVVFAV
ncbi:hypothetical protein DSCO28_72990 (plasmid) [Desulfosarcina ovata subsp. sediminis]|uniref:Uncharacterized protein n=1 Tax=Desulfosarcina ovata subsp. sediminis TaxID=885957 RepID=A0A5K8A2F7_9BACT|nr:hypothetical protein [Desulfosarcina ovata]BBO86733.1 hypothetical protein DSCO28_72990 [Desulfosarcina ovata subsp. sediminis]